MEISGNIKVLNDTQVIGNKDFRKRELVITTEEKYPQHISIEFTHDKCELLDNFKVNQDVKVAINLRGREWVNPQGEVKYFNSINGWKIEVIEPTNKQPLEPIETNPLSFIDDQDSDVPF